MDAEIDRETLHVEIASKRRHKCTNGVRLAAMTSGRTRCYQAVYVERHGPNSGGAPDLLCVPRTCGFAHARSVGFLPLRDHSDLLTHTHARAI